MRIYRRQAVQGHAVPDRAGYPMGPFNPEVLAPPVIVPMEPEDDMAGWTVQEDKRG